jgi:biopolymer transport protein TolR
VARTFRRHRQSHPIAELNVTNLIDLGFMLLIIFMITTPLINQEQNIPINLPTQSKNTVQRPPSDSKVIVVSIDAKGNYYYADAKTPTPLAEVSSRFKALDPKKTLISIRGDGNVPLQKVVSLMDEMSKYNLSQVKIGTQVR